MKNSQQRGNSSRRLFVGLTVLFALIAYRITVAVREDRAARVELTLENMTEVPVAATYYGRYRQARTTIPAGQSWTIPFRNLDALILQAVYSGLALSNQVLLTDDRVPNPPPRRLRREIYLVREIRDSATGVVSNYSVIRSIPDQFRDAREPDAAGTSTTNIVCW